MQALSSVQGYLMFVVWTNDTPIPSNVLQSEIKITFHLCASLNIVSWDFAIWTSCVLFAFKNQKTQGQSAI